MRTNFGSNLWFCSRSCCVSILQITTCLSDFRSTKPFSTIAAVRKGLLRRSAKGYCGGPQRAIAAVRKELKFILSTREIWNGKLCDLAHFLLQPGNIRAEKFAVGFHFQQRSLGCVQSRFDVITVSGQLIGLSLRVWSLHLKLQIAFRCNSFCIVEKSE